MAGFENVIGYDSLKQELSEILDIMQHKEVYEPLNVSCPRGLLLYGAPGLGKTLIANSFIELSGRPSVICRKNASEQSFIDSISEAFLKAVDLAPSIILLDDMDKFANDDSDHKDSEAYVTIQSCIDMVKDEEVFVLATANNIRKLPDSLIRTGRFDHRIRVHSPNKEDSQKIIEHYLKGKNLDETVDLKSLAALFVGASCSTLEAIINQAGIIAGYKRAASITMDDMVNGYLQIEHHIPKSEVLKQKKINLSATDGSADVIWHEAAHAVIAELFAPGSTTMIIGLSDGQSQHGFTISNLEGIPMSVLEKRKLRIMVSLSSAAAMDIIFGRVDFGAEDDIEKALLTIDDAVSDMGGFAGLSMASYGYDAVSQALKDRRQVAVSSIAELYYQETKELLCKNREFLQAMAEALVEKRILTAPDIADIRKSLGM